MNNSQISLEIEQLVDTSPILRKRETELLAIIEAFERVSSSDYWKLIEDKVLTGVMDSLQKRLRQEKNPTEIYRLQGQLEWAEKYLDISKFSQVYLNELTSIRKRLNGKND